MRILVMEPNQPARVANIESDEKGSYLKELQRLVGGLIEPVDVLCGEQPLLWVNDSGLIDGLPLNRAIIATKQMEERGYLSCRDMKTPVKKGDTYTYLAGTVLACSYDRDADGEEIMRDITDEEIAQVCKNLRMLIGIPKSAFHSIGFIDESN